MLSTLADLLTRPFRHRRLARAAPQRLLALVALRRQIIADALHLTGSQADEAAFALENHLRARLNERALTVVEKHLIAIGLISRGQFDGFGLFEQTLPYPPPPISLHALRLLFPLTRRVRKSTDPLAITNWVRENRRRLKWDEENERYIVR
ncbi:MAG: hypothetical protein JWN40_3286 [Phycisphaerales bacterium]|nr:hypothetical protein [Phycisphaerales bacterium]